MKLSNAIWIVLAVPAVAGAVQLSGPSSASGSLPPGARPIQSGHAPAAPMIGGTVNSVAANCTSITIDGKRFSATAMTRVHTSAGVATLNTVNIQPGSPVRFMLAALSPDGTYLVTPRIAEIWVAQ